MEVKNTIYMKLPKGGSNITQPNELKFNTGVEKNKMTNIE